MAVAFLMFIFIIFSSLYDTDNGHDNTDNRQDNTDNIDYKQHRYVSVPIFSIMYHLQRYRKFSKCKHFGERRTAGRLGSTRHYNTILYSNLQYVQDCLGVYDCGDVWILSKEGCMFTGRRIKTENKNLQVDNAGCFV